MATWRDDIVAALEALGGIGQYQEIYAEVAARRADLSPHWQATVRRSIEWASSDSVTHRPGTEDLFYSVHGLGKGVWGLRRMPAEHRTVAETADPERSAEQGYAADSVVRAAIERHAVRLAVAHYEQVGARDIEEVGKPYDLRMRLDGREVHVEVKGSTRPLESVTLTRNEVTDARTNGTNHLFVVDQIRLTTDPGGAVSTSRGRQRVWADWVPTSESLTAMVYSHLLPSDRPQATVTALEPTAGPDRAPGR